MYRVWILPDVMLAEECIVLSGGVCDYPPYGFTLTPYKKGPCPGRAVDFPEPPTTGSSCFAHICKFLLLKLLEIWIRLHVSLLESLLNLDFWGFPPTTRYCSTSSHVSYVSLLKTSIFTGECWFHQKYRYHCIYWVNGIKNESGIKAKPHLL